MVMWAASIRGLSLVLPLPEECVLGFRPLIGCLLILASLPSAASVAALDARKYAALRKARAVTVALSAAKADPEPLIGKAIEIRGRVAGTSRNVAGNQCIIISTAEDGSFVVNAAELPEENPGLEVACLVAVGPGSVHGLGDLSLLAWTYDIDLKRIEQASKPVSKPSQARQTAAQTTKPAGSQPAAVTAEQLVRAYKNAVKGFNRKLSDAQADTIARSILGFSYKYKVDARLVCAVILAESHFRVGATSGAGAQGLGQLMPSTAAGLGVNNAYDPVENVYGSVRYIRSMLDRTSGNKKWHELTWNDLSLALAAYNAGPGAVKKHGGVPPYRETQNYVRRVTSIYKQLCGVKG